LRLIHPQVIRGPGLKTWAVQPEMIERHFMLTGVTGVYIIIYSGKETYVARTRAFRRSMLKVTFPDGSTKEYEPGTTAAQVAADIGPRLAKAAVAAKVDGRLADLSTPLTKDASLEIVTEDSPEGVEVLRHSASHIMADAVTRLRKNVKLAIGPAIKDGFYYDFELEQPLAPDDLKKVEEGMASIAAQDLPFEHIELLRDEAIKQMQEAGQSYKVELLEEIPDEKVTFYRHGDFVDLCRGPHAPSTGCIKHYRLLSLAGAYWRGDEKNQMLQRVYGTAFPKKKELEEHLAKLEEAKRRDHRRLGRELDIYSVHQDVGSGLIHWHPKGAMIRHIIEDFWTREHLKRGYQLVYTPHIASEKIYQISGHLENYAENMYGAMEIDKEPYRLKPMNCPGHILIYKTKKRSYRELPIRYAELGTVYRYERSGVLMGMLRVRGFTQDDAHIFCTPEQLVDEVYGVVKLSDFMMRSFGYRYKSYIATRPEKAMGSVEDWDMAVTKLRKAAERFGIEYEIDHGGGVFYGPKIDIKLVDALDREWQGPTIQVDFNMPERFDVNYTGADGKEHRVVMVHRTVLGSMERFVGGLIEHYGGNFPLWLAPVQVRVIAITDRQKEYANALVEQLRGEDIRAEGDLRREKLSAMIRDAELEKIPYMLVVGDREEEKGTVSVRTKSEGDLGAMKVEDLIARIYEEVRKKK
jgi:threonyl-tRNA synthetase